MARLSAEVGTHADHRVDTDFSEAIDYYWGRLHDPAQFPWAGNRFEPVIIGPTWQVTPDGFWKLPEATLGWQALGWTGSRLQLKRDTPWRYTDEQARFVLWWYAIDELGDFIYRDGILQRLKGWGKDPVGSTLCALEAFGPCRFLEYDGLMPVATDVDEAWVQMAAVSQEQTKNTTRLFPQLFKPETIREYGIRIGKEYVYGLGDSRLIQAVTSSPTTLEGARATKVLKNETQHWDDSNGGHDMEAVLERNTTKSADGAARALAITNAPEPSSDSVGLRAREAYELAMAGESLTTGILYDSLEAPPDAPLTAEDAPEVLEAVKGDSHWLNSKRIVKSILDTRNPPSRSRRFWYNQVVAAEDAWLDPRFVDICSFPDAPKYEQGEKCFVFFDGSKSDDATAAVACRLSDGFLQTVGVWHRPPGARGKNWIVNRSTVDHTIREFLDNHRVIGLFADPSHTVDDETSESFWDETIDGWHRDYGSKLKLKASGSKRGHSVMWDMVDPTKVKEFTAAAERFVTDVEDTADPDNDRVALGFDGDARLRTHLKNARRYPNRYGVSLWKGHRESPKKIDAAVCAVGARMMRRKFMIDAGSKQPGKVHY